MNKREELLDSLSSGLEPVSPAPDLRMLAALWFVFSALYVMVLTQLLGPIRPTALGQLQSEPRFLLEMLLGVALAAGLALSSFQIAMPAALGRLLSVMVGVLGALWLGGFVVGLVDPALEPSMAGKRHHCYLESFLYASPPLVALLYWQRRLYPLQPGKAAVVAGLSAGMLPALYMQIACMYQPAHILAFHVGPALVIAAAAPLVLRLWPRRGA